MSKGSNFSRIMAKRYGITIKEAGSIVALFVGTVRYCMMSGIDANIRGMFKIGTKKREAYVYHDPRTGNMDEKPEMRIPYCKFGVEIKNAINTEEFTGEFLDQNEEDDLDNEDEAEG